MKLRFSVAFFLVVSLLVAPVMAAEVKMAFVDLNKALNECKAGKIAKDKMQKKFKEYEGEIVAKQKELKTLKDELEKQGALLSAEAKTEKMRHYEQKVKDFQRFTKDARDTIKQQDNDYTREIVQELLQMVRDMGSDGKYTLIMEKREGSIIYGSKEIDLTEQLIRRHDQKKSR